MLAAALVGPRDSDEQVSKNLANIIYPVLATPKLDGIRCVTIPGERKPGDKCKPVCRSLLDVPNEHIRDLIATFPVGLDGEIMTYSERDLFDGAGVAPPRRFNDILSDVMNRVGRPNFKFHVFDSNVYEHSEISLNYADRVKMLMSLELPHYVEKVLPTRCNNSDELQAFMSLSLQQGHEGICFRSMLSCPYKFGRSTLRQQWLIKWKLFATSEAKIIGFEQEYENLNKPKEDLLGHQVRSSHQDNMFPKGTLGSFICETEDGVQFNVGTGFTASMRLDYWNRREELLGKLVTYKHQGHGAKTAPRIPVFVGIRPLIDL